MVVKSKVPADELVAAIDLGSNSAHLVIANLNPSGHLHVVDSDKIMLRLAQHVDARGNLTKEAIENTVSAFKQMQEISSAYTDTIRAVATYATREAKNHKQLIKRVADATGIEIEVIEGIEEARLEFLGVQQGLSLDGKDFLLVDIGGGSTEISIGTSGSSSPKHAASLKIGAVTMTEMAKVSGFEKVEKYINSRIAPLQTSFREAQYDIAVASSGTAKTLATMVAQEFFDEVLSDTNGYTFERKHLDKILARLRELDDPEAIRTEFGVDAKRSDIILAGTAILAALSRKFKVKRWTVSNYSLREGLVLETLKKHYTDRESIVQGYASKLGVESAYSAHIRKLCLSIYDSLDPFFQKAVPFDDERDLLGYAGYLSEIGKVISFSRFHRHSSYMIENSNIMMFSQVDKELMSAIVRYHRKSLPSRSKVGAYPLLYDDVERLQFLCGCLRLATCLNRTRRSKVESVSTKKIGKGKLVIHAHYKPQNTPPETELFKCNLELPALEKSFGFELEFKAHKL